MEKRMHGELFSFSLVSITISLMQFAILYGKKYGLNFKYFCLMSGQDYPIVSSDEIWYELSMAYPKPFIDCTPRGNQNWVDKGASICIWYKKFSRALNKNVIKNTVIRRMLKAPFYFINIVMRKAFSVKCVLEKNGISLYGGSQWWILPDNIVEFVVDKYSTIPENSPINPLKYIGSPDETFFQTVLMNSEYADKIEVNPPEMVAQNCKTYANFTPEGKEFMGHPYIITMEDTEMLKKLSKTRFFARKFDTEVDSEILDWIDCNLLG